MSTVVFDYGFPFLFIIAQNLSQDCSYSFPNYSPQKLNIRLVENLKKPDTANVYNSAYEDVDWKKE